MNKLGVKKQVRVVSGFTLIELIIVMVLLSVAAVPILGMYIEAAKSSAANLDLQTAIQLVQECSELILAQKRLDTAVYPAYGYAGITDCSALAAKFPFNGFTAPPAITITDPFTDTGCPDVAANCKLIQVNAIKNGSTLASMSFMVANY